MTPKRRCEWCDNLLPPSRGGPRARRFCSDACRKRQARAGEVVTAGPAAAEGPVTAAVRAALVDTGFGAVGEARAQLALALARLVDAGSVPAARELRPCLDVLDLVMDADTTAFLASVQTPNIVTSRR